MQAKDIDDRELLSYVNARVLEQGRWFCVFDLDGKWAEIPFKVMQAKFGKLIKRGFMTGCNCGCRGDYEVTMLGRGYIMTPPTNT